MQYAIAYRKQVMTEKEKIQRCFCNSRFGQWVKCLYLRQWWDCWCVRGRGKVGGMAHQTRGEWGAAWALSREQCSVDNVYSRAKRRRWLAVRNGVITLRRDTREVPSSAVQLQQYSTHQHTGPPAGEMKSLAMTGISLQYKLYSAHFPNSRTVDVVLVSV